MIFNKLIFTFLCLFLGIVFSQEQDLSLVASHHHGKKARHWPDLKLIQMDPPHFPMNDLILGKSKTLDYLGNHYYYFVFNKRSDLYVSDAMQRNGGVWEGFLNDLLKHLVDTEIAKNPNRHLKDLVVVDAGANLGSFTLFAASLGVKVWAFEMQLEVYTVLEMSLRMSGYRDHARVYNIPLWNSTREMYYTTMRQNFGGAYLRRDPAPGEVKVNTSRLDTVVTDPRIFFIKLDTEGVEEYVLNGFDSKVNQKLVKHIAIGDSGQPHFAIYEWLYRVGYVCRNFGPDTNNLRIQGCDNHANYDKNTCEWPTFNDLVNVVGKLNRGHFNIVCSLP
jgi:FkbM family methyltransferase